jgi:hypothetical protein
VSVCFGCALLLARPGVVCRQELAESQAEISEAIVFRADVKVAAMMAAVSVTEKPLLHQRALMLLDQ